MTWTRVQKSTAYATTGTGTLPSNATARNLVVAFVHGTSNVAFAGPAGWYQASGQGIAGTRTEIWYLPPQSNLGGFSSAAFTVSGTARCALAEYHTDVATPQVNIDSQGSNTASAATSLGVTENGSNVAGGLGVCGFMEHFASATAVTWTDPSGFTVSNSITASNANPPYCADDLSVGSGTLSITGSTGTSGAWSGALVVFRATVTPPLATYDVEARRQGQVKRPRPTVLLVTPPSVVTPVVSRPAVARRPRRQPAIRSVAALTPAAPPPAVSAPAPQLPRRNRQRLAGRLSVSQPAPGAVSQPVPVRVVQLPARQRRWPRRLPTGPQPAPGAVSQPLPAQALERPRRLFRRAATRTAALSVPPAPAVQASQPKRVRLKLPRRLPQVVPGQTVVPPAQPAPSPARPRKLAWRAARRAAASAVAPVPAAPPRAPEPRRRLPRRWRSSSSQPAPGAVFQPLPVPAQQPKRRQPQRRWHQSAAPQVPAPRPVQPSREPAHKPVPRKPRTALRTVPPVARPALPAMLRRVLWKPLRRRVAPAPSVPQGGASVTILLGDVLGITDTLHVSTGVTWHVDAAGARWQATSATARWLMASAAARWQAETASSRWQTSATSSRWSAALADFDPIAAISQEAVPVVWTSELGGVTTDPTNPLLVVECAFPVSSGNASAPAEPVTWYPATWVTGTTSRGFFAECPVGAGTTGPTLVAGQRYDVWSQVQAGPENAVVKYAGTITVY